MPSWDAIARNQLQDGAEGGGNRRLAPPSAWLRQPSQLGLTSQRIQAVLEPLGIAEFVARHAPTDAVAGRHGTGRLPRLARVRPRPDRTGRPAQRRAGRTRRRPARGLRRPPGRAYRRAQLSQKRRRGPAFEDVLPREDVFSVPTPSAHRTSSPSPTPSSTRSTSPLLGEVFDDEPFEPWNHKRDGIVAKTTGDAVDETASLADAHLFDVAPTVLTTLGISAQRPDGRRALPIVDETPARRYPEFEARERTDTDDEAVEGPRAPGLPLGGVKTAAEQPTILADSFRRWRPRSLTRTARLERLARVTVASLGTTGLPVTLIELFEERRVADSGYTGCRRGRSRSGRCRCCRWGQPSRSSRADGGGVRGRPGDGDVLDADAVVVAVGVDVVRSVGRRLRGMAATSSASTVTFVSRMVARSGQLRHGDGAVAPGNLLHLDVAVLDQNVRALTEPDPAHVAEPLRGPVTADGDAADLGRTADADI